MEELEGNTAKKSGVSMFNLILTLVLEKHPAICTWWPRIHVPLLSVKRREQPLSDTEVAAFDQAHLEASGLLLLFDSVLF
jgi:hypothetical protein